MFDTEAMCLDLAGKPLYGIPGGLGSYINITARNCEGEGCAPLSAQQEWAKGKAFYLGSVDVFIDFEDFTQPLKGVVGLL